MMNRVLAWAAFAVFCAFLGILVTKVQRLDLTIIVGLTVLLALWDTVRATRGDKPKG
ncbi:hypothetical protein [Szabonella alba]|uniref:Uncharacterized protein n=1 Tax=Szabonella alba TaxID=2804194 RepID=A0A8K0XZK9_9RHOB|nr:hypothetical protein [Szabonella alba]MBL4916158.1 hypothetical protein [Szabonella alba]